MTTAAIFSVTGARACDAGLAALSGESAIAIAIARARRIAGVSIVSCLIEPGEAGDGLAEAALDAGALVTRAQTGDRAAGLLDAAREADADRILHITGVQPFLDPVIAAGVLCLLADAPADVATNAAPALFPDGLDCEAAATATLERWPETSLASTMRRALRGARLANLRGPGGGMERLRWRLETAADIAFARAVHQALGPAALTAGAAEIAGLCLRRPDIAGLNAGDLDDARLGGGDHGAVQTRPVSFLRAA